MIEIIVPLPPSANRIWRKSGKRIHKSAAYTTWLARTVIWIHAQQFEPFDGKVRVDLELPVNNRRDIDNSIKPVLDCLEAAGVFANDRQVKQLWVAEATRTDVLIRITALPAAVHGQERAA